MEVVWYFAPDGAKTYRGVNAFSSGIWDRDTPAKPPLLGERPPYASPYYKGENVWGYVGQCRVGTDYQFANGLSAADLAKPFKQIPSCCGPPIEGLAGGVGSGGDGSGCVGKLGTPSGAELPDAITVTIFDVAQVSGCAGTYTLNVFNPGRTWWLFFPPTPAVQFINFRNDVLPGGRWNLDLGLNSIALFNSQEVIACKDEPGTFSTYYSFGVPTVGPFFIIGATVKYTPITRGGGVGGGGVKDLIDHTGGGGVGSGSVTEGVPSIVGGGVGGGILLDQGVLIGGGVGGGGVADAIDNVGGGGVGGGILLDQGVLIGGGVGGGILLDQGVLIGGGVGGGSAETTDGLIGGGVGGGGIEDVPGSLRSLRFDGASVYVTVPTAVVLQPTSALSLCCWIKTTQTTLGRLFTQPKDPGGTQKTSYCLLIGYPVAGHVTLFADIGFVVTMSSTSVINDGAWHHVAATWDGTTAKLYVDGVLENSGAVSGPPTYDASAIVFGRYGAIGQYYAGEMDNLGFWGRALSSTEIADLAALSITVLSLAPDGAWPFFEGGDSTLHDTSGNANDGTASVVSLWSLDHP